MRLLSRLREASRSRSRPETSPSPAVPEMSSITIDDKGTKFSFLDSGAPRHSTSYITFIAVHGMGFTSGIFRKIIFRSSKENCRFIAVARRGYPSSTPLSEAEIKAATSGTDEEKEKFCDSRGVELAKFVDKLTQQLDLCPISRDGKSGGIALLGWSAGNTWTLSCIANIDQLSSESRNRMKACIRAHVIYEPPSICLGLPLPPKIWSPLIDTSLPEDQRVPFYMTWVTSYFDHGDLSSRNADVVSYCTPSLTRAPSIYNMSVEDIKDVVVEGTVTLETTIMFMTQTQSNAIYRKACFSESIKSLLPNMKTTILVGDATCSFSLSGLFSIQDDNDKNRSDLQFVVVPGTNHFMQWDDPEKALNVYLNAAL